MDWQVVEPSQFPVVWTASPPLVGVLYVKKSTLGALMRTIESFPHPIILVHQGKVARDSVVDSYLLSQCGLDMATVA